MTASSETGLITHFPAETHALGVRLGKQARAGDVIALIGDLGAGKTILTKGIASGLGADPDEVTSPTFVLMARHEARVPLYHFDAYRLSGPDEILEIGAEEAFYGNGVSVIEWADHVAEALPPDRLEIRIKTIAQTEREVCLAATGPRSAALAESVGPTG